VEIDRHLQLPEPEAYFLDLWEYAFLWWSLDMEVHPERYEHLPEETKKILIGYRQQINSTKV
jgi:hypothetical protein